MLLIRLAHVCWHFSAKGDNLGISLTSFNFISIYCAFNSLIVILSWVLFASYSFCALLFFFIFTSPIAHKCFMHSLPESALIHFLPKVFFYFPLGVYLPSTTAPTAMVSLLSIPHWSLQPLITMWTWPVLPDFGENQKWNIKWTQINSI